jgi:hypothetical protein
MDPRAAVTPKPPYYCVIFTSRRTGGHGDDYGAPADRMLMLGSGRLMKSQCSMSRGSFWDGASDDQEVASARQ